MSRILRDKSNIVVIPQSVSVTKKGYVYVNQTTFWRSKKNGSGKTADHKKVCIGIALHPGENWRDDRRMYANSTYYDLYPVEESVEENTPVYEEYPKQSDCISVGLYAVVKEVAEELGLIDILVSIFGSEYTRLILDLAMYMISAESAIFQHFPHWCRSHYIFSESIRSDSYISRFEKEMISLSQINLFKKKWANRIIDDGRIFVCYDSTNVNSQASGVFIVQKGHAKDDPDKEQVNTEYAIRQSDGMPLTYKTYPGSINDIAEASEMILFFKDLLEKQPGNNMPEISEKTQIVVIVDRGYVSEDNIKGFTAAGIGFILMLKKNMSIYNELLDEYLAEIKQPSNYDRESGQFSYTVSKKLFDDDEKDSYFHIIWSAELECAHRKALYSEIDSKEAKLKKIVERETLLTETEMKKYLKYFKLLAHESGSIEVEEYKKDGVKVKKEVPVFMVDAYEKKEDEIKQLDSKCGYFIYVSSEKMSAKEALKSIKKRDCVEKVFRSLKSMLGMDKYGVQTEAAMHSKSLIWFIASILHAGIFKKSESGRAKDKKHFTVPAIVDQLEEITADKNLERGKYERRYNPTHMQKRVLSFFGATEETLDEIILNM